jgi:hypothetical protein
MHLRVFSPMGCLEGHMVLVTVHLRVNPPVYQNLLVEQSRGLDKRQWLSLLGTTHL